MSDELQKKVDRAIKLLQSAEKKAKEFGEPVEICYSGGKDSDVILELARMANIYHKAIYKNTTIDPPGTIKHAMDMNVEIKRPKETFFQIMGKHGIPSRFFRFCCSLLKEYKIYNVAVIGIRRSESPARAKRYKEPQMCIFYGGRKKNHVHGFYPILDWSDKDVEEFLKERNIKCAPVYYDENGKFCVERRLGCMCCPLQSQNRLRQDFKNNPKMLKQWANRGGGNGLKANELRERVALRSYSKTFTKNYFTFFFVETWKSLDKRLEQLYLTKDWTARNFLKITLTLNSKTNGTTEETRYKGKKM